MFKVLLTSFFSLLIISAFSQAYIDPKLFKNDWTDSQPVVIVFNQKSINVTGTWSKVAKGNYVYEQLVAESKIKQLDVVNYLMSQNQQFQSFYIINGISTSLTQNQAIAISRMDDVKAIVGDYDVFSLDYMESNNSLKSRSVEPEWGIKKIGADILWEQGFKGKGVVIGGLDTGFEWYLDALKPKYRGYVNDSTAQHVYNWHDGIHTSSPLNADTINPCGFSSLVPCDDGNHGTHTMGTMIGSDSTNQIGVAPEAQWIACRNMDRGWGKPSSYLECFEWMLAPRDLNYNNPRPDLSPDVINNSWYCADIEGCDDINRFLFDDAIKNMKAAGIVVVVSAGNSGGQGCGSISETPALFKSSFSVGATNIEDQIAGFSSRGPSMIDSTEVWLKPNVSAPGVDVRSVIKDGTFANFSGTSMAGPHVAGAVALIISANPNLRGQVELIEDILEATAIPLTSDMDCDTFAGFKVPNAVFGHGRINVLAAVERAIQLSNTTQFEPSVSIDVYPNPASDIITIDGFDQLINGIVIRDLQGKIIRSYSYGNDRQLITLGVVDLIQGIYLLEVNTSMGKQIVKLVKK
jgi:serine protease AprX